MPHPFSSCPPPSLLLPWPLATTLPLSVAMDLPRPTFHINGTTHIHSMIHVWLPSLSMTFLRFIQIVACIRTSLPFMGEYYSTVWTYHLLFIH